MNPSTRMPWNIVRTNKYVNCCSVSHVMALFSPLIRFFLCTSSARLITVYWPRERATDGDAASRVTFCSLVAVQLDDVLEGGEDATMRFMPTKRVIHDATRFPALCLLAEKLSLPAAF